MRVSNTNHEEGRTLTFVLPPLLTQHKLPLHLPGDQRPAARAEGSCEKSTPRTLNNCFYRTRGPLSPQ